MFERYGGSGKNLPNYIAVMSQYRKIWCQNPCGWHNEHYVLCEILTSNVHVFIHSNHQLSHTHTHTHTKFIYACCKAKSCNLPFPHKIKSPWFLTNVTSVHAVCMFVCVCVCVCMWVCVWMCNAQECLNVFQKADISRRNWLCTYKHTKIITCAKPKRLKIRGGGG